MNYQIRMIILNDLMFKLLLSLIKSYRAKLFNVSLSRTGLNPPNATYSYLGMKNSKKRILTLKIARHLCVAS